METKGILETNHDVLVEFFEGQASGQYYDGTSYQLYLDLNNGEIFENHEPSDNSWLQREDGSLAKLESISGYIDLPEEELYTEECDIYDFGFQDWLDGLESTIDGILSAVEDYLE